MTMKFMVNWESRRVPLDFDAPLGEPWPGYVTPDTLDETNCETCDGSGYSAEGRRLHDLWWGYTPADPADTGSTPFTPETPEVRAFAERNVTNAPEFYGRGELAILREAHRLLTMWNKMWQHHLDQDDVDALIAAGRLIDLTHRFIDGQGWTAIEPAPTVTAEQVNRWSLLGFGHDAINCGVVIRAKCKRLGVPETCERCDGHGSIEVYPGQRAEAEAWEPTDPPTGDGWQLWNTNDTGTPSSPVSPSAEALASWCVETGQTMFGYETAPYADWLQLINDNVFLFTA